MRPNLKVNVYLPQTYAITQQSRRLGLRESRCLGGIASVTRTPSLKVTPFFLLFLIIFLATIALFALIRCLIAVRIKSLALLLVSGYLALLLLSLSSSTLLLLLKLTIIS